MSGGRIARDVTICNVRGLHARAAAKFCDCAGRFEADVTVRSGEATVGGCSLMALLMLGAAPGTPIEIAAEGPDAEAALAALCALVEDRFEEDE